jgi:putative toxin-antitoxin system antitoxin component (TIGR02293 family)
MAPSLWPIARREKDPVTEAEGLTYARRIGLRSRSVAQLMDSVEQGLRYQSLANLQKSMRLSTREIARAVEISERTLARRKSEGRLKREESERLVRISRVFDKAVGLFEGDEQAATRWLRRPARALDEKTPLEYASTEIGAREVENLIGRLEHGVFS